SVLDFQYQNLHSFPTRRSSDLAFGAVWAWGKEWDMNTHGPRSYPRMGKTSTKGFSLIELLIVVFIILIISAIAIPSLFRSKIARSEEHTSELQSRFDLVCRLLL